jgi:two-component system NtrC family sensor kinase
LNKTLPGRKMSARKRNQKPVTIYEDGPANFSSETDVFSDMLSENSRDITERKKAVKELRESQEFAASLLENAPHATVVINPDTSVRYVNPAWEHLNGWSLAEVIGMKAPYPWWPEEYKDVFIEGFKAAMKQGSGKGEVIAVKKNGEYYWIDMNWASVMHNGELQYLLINSLDVTERKTAEEKRQAILKTSPDGFWICDLSGKFLEVNDSYCTMTGYTQEELLKMSIKDVEARENPEIINRRIKKIREQGSDRFETQHKCKDGRIIDIEISVKYYNIGEEQLFVFVRDITERKAAEKALRESEEKFSKAFNASPGLMSIRRLRDGKFMEVNESFLRDKGYTRREIIGRSSSDFAVWTDADEGKRIIKTLEEGGKVHNEVMQYRTKSGYIRTGLVSAEIINIGNEPCMIVLTNDITQQKQAEEQLRLLSSVTQQVSDSIIITDPAFKITYINQAARDLFGYSIEEVRGKGFDVFNDDEKPLSEKFIKNILKTVNSGRVWKGSTTKKRKNGTKFICDCHISPLFDEKGNIYAYTDVQQDVTDQKEVEAKIQAQKKLIESILATMPEGVLVADASDRVILANESIYKILHRTRNSLINRPLQKIIRTEQLLNLYDSVKAGQKETGTLEFRYRVPPFEKIITCVAIKMESERTLLTFTDVSREREEEEKLYLTDRLASIGEMAAGLAHELNNPLTGILSLSQLLIDSDIPPASKEDLQCISSEARRAASIVKNVLLFTRNNNYENGQASANEVVKDILRLREYEEKTNNIKIVTNLQPDLPEVAVDKFQLQQVFLNIILNAEAAIKDAGRPGLLTIKTEKVNNHINIMFTDNGCGIKKHVLPRIFDPFFTTKDIGKGTGLGLSICYGIVVKHGGKISVKTRVNEGTTFTVRMPIAPPI